MGAEGPTDDAEINKQREKQMRNFLATIMLSQGVPMLTGGDEVARSQQGNNNAFCQDDELTWYDWNLDAPRRRLMEFTAQLIHLRLDHPNLHRRKFFQDRSIRTKSGGSTIEQDIAWYNPNGNQFSDEDWSTTNNKSIGLLLNGTTLGYPDEDGKKIVDDSFFLLINSYHEGVEFTLPQPLGKTPWSHILNTDNIDDPFKKAELAETIIVPGRSLILLSDGSTN